MSTPVASSSHSKLSNPLFSPTPEQLRSLVLDYLCHNCYTRTAKAFARDSTVRHLDADGDEIIPPAQGSDDIGSPAVSEHLFDQVQQRQEIRNCILRGHVEEATDFLNKYFPTVLSETGQNGSPSQASYPSSPTSRDIEYLASTSIEPQHLSLNLRILAFIEACRTAPLEYPPHNASNPSVITSPPNSSKEDPAQLEEQHSILLSKARKLYALAKALPHPSDYATYDKELENVCGLLAYKVPENSSVSRYLSMQRREAVADQINRAILRKCGQAPISSIELYTRYTHVLWLLANKHGAKPRAGAVLPPTITKAAGAVSSKTEGDDEAVPLFDLQQFLELKP